MSRLNSFIQACILTIFTTMVVCALFFGYIWRNGLLNPDESEDAINAILIMIGPWAFAIDIFIISPLLWWIVPRDIFKPKVKIIKGIMTDKSIPILPPPMPQMIEPTTDAAIWEEIRQRQDINSKDDTF
jgi:hypothetical protein